MIEPFPEDYTADDSIPLDVECSCGEVVAVVDECAAQLECPACGETLQIDDPPPEDEFDDNLSRASDEHEAEGEERSFLGELLPSVTFPLRGNAPYMLFGAWLLGTPVIFASRFTVLAWFVLIPATNFFITFLFDVVSEAVKGSARVPEWPNFGRELQSLVEFVCGVAAAGLPFSVAIWALWFSGAGFVTWAPLLAGLGLLAAVLLGPALLSVILFGPWAAFDYPRLLRAVAVTPFNTALLVLMTVGIHGLVAAIAVLHDRFPLFQFVSLLPLMYLSVAYAHLVGVYYFTNRRRLNWLRTKPGRERKRKRNGDCRSFLFLLVSWLP